MMRPVIYDPYSRQMQEEPYPTYRYFRDEEPCTHNPQMDFYALFRFEDVWDATLLGWEGGGPAPLAGRTCGACFAPILENKGDVPGGVMSTLGRAPPRHVRIRNLVSKGFTPRRIADLEAEMRRIARRYLDAVA